MKSQCHTSLVLIRSHYLFESLLQKTTLSTSQKSSITPRQVSYKKQPSLRNTRSITRAEHLNNYYCGCCSELLLGAQPAALQVTVRAHSQNTSWAGGSQERAKPPGHTRSRYGNVTQLLHCTWLLIITHNTQQIWRVYSMSDVSLYPH